MSPFTDDPLRHPLEDRAPAPPKTGPAPDRSYATRAIPPQPRARSKAERRKSAREARNALDNYRRAVEDRTYRAQVRRLAIATCTLSRLVELELGDGFLASDVHELGRRLHEIADETSAL